MLRFMTRPSILNRTWLEKNILLFYTNTSKKKQLLESFNLLGTNFVMDRYYDLTFRLRFETEFCRLMWPFCCFIQNSMTCQSNISKQCFCYASLSSQVTIKSLSRWRIVWEWGRTNLCGPYATEEEEKFGKVWDNYWTHSFHHVPDLCKSKDKWFISPSTCKTSLCFKLCLTHGKLWVTFQVPGSCILASSRTSVESISISLLPMTTEYNRRGHEGDAINSGLPDK